MSNSRDSLRMASGILSAVCMFSRCFGADTADHSLPKPAPIFHGKIDPNRDNSIPDWPGSATAAKGAPNIVVVLLDDVGFGAASVFGGPVKTPAIEQLAAGGLRYNRFHVNSLCSPTRASLLSGRNDHSIGFGTVEEGASGYPGYNGIWPKSAASVAEILKQNGYSTAAFGKWHNTPLWEVSPAGPFDHWPTSLGFEYYYGFMGGADNQWHPRLFRNTTAVEPPNNPNYHLTTDLADDAIHWVHEHDAVAPSKPFFLYFATGATHEPHHVPQEWVNKYKGHFDQGWDKLREQTYARQKEFGVIPASAELTPRPVEIPGWDSLDSSQKKLLAHQMEVYAGFLAHTDYEVGRMLAGIRSSGHVEDTIVFYIVGDNGASAEGGLEGLGARTVTGAAAPLDQRLEQADQLGGELFRNHYAVAWAWACNSPFQWSKQVASHLGGTRVPLIVSWPGHIGDAGALRTQFHHVTDIAPTLFDLAQVQFPDTVNGVKQIPLAGVSMVYSFSHTDQPSAHTMQYFEMLGNRGIYKDGWWAGSRNMLPWKINLSGKNDPYNNPWELYNLDADYSQAHNLAASNPDKLKEMEALFDSEARKYNVYPLTPTSPRHPLIADDATSFVYRPGVDRISIYAAPQLAGRAHRITASINVPQSGAEGVILSEGGRFGGFSLFVKDQHVIYSVNSFGNDAGTVVSPGKIEPGPVQVVLEFTPEEPKAEKANIPGGAVSATYALRSIGPGTVHLWINGKAAGEGQIASLGGYTFESLDVGSDLGTPVSNAYQSPFRFTGAIDTVRVDIQ